MCFRILLYPYNRIKPALVPIMPSGNNPGILIPCRIRNWYDPKKSGYHEVNRYILNKTSLPIKRILAKP